MVYFRTISVLNQIRRSLALSTPTLGRGGHAHFFFALHPQPTPPVLTEMPTHSRISDVNIPQSYFRYEPISPSYDPNEFVNISFSSFPSFSFVYNKKMHQNSANFDRPKRGYISKFFLVFFKSS